LNIFYDFSVNLKYSEKNEKNKKRERVCFAAVKNKQSLPSLSAKKFKFTLDKTKYM